MNVSSSSTGYAIAKALVEHQIDPVRAADMLADPEQKLALSAYLDSFRVPPPLPELYADGRPKLGKPPKPDKVRAAVLRSLKAAVPSSGALTIQGSVLKATIVGVPRLP